MSESIRYTSISADIVIEPGKLYCVTSPIVPVTDFPKADRIYTSDISLLIPGDWLQLYREDTNGYYDMNSPFLVLDIGPSKLIQLSSDPPTSFHEVWLYILYEERRGWIKVDTNRLEEVI
jgi:hypothetical protein